VSGEARTAHSINPVPLLLIGERYKRTAPRTDADLLAAKQEVGGILTDVAPTILAILEIPKPEEMTGQNLLPGLLV